MIWVNTIIKKIIQTHETYRGKWIEINIYVEEFILKATQVKIKNKYLENQMQ